MNEEKWIKELEDRVMQLEQQLEILDARLNARYWYPPQPYCLTCQKQQIIDGWPTIAADTAES